jgi:MFS superfamily sulfate permease-like transporter
MGLTGSLSSFFGTYPVCSALGRSMLAAECGGRTQFSSVFAASLLLVVILFIGPFLAQASKLLDKYIN